MRILSPLRTPRAKFCNIGIPFRKAVEHSRVFTRATYSEPLPALPPSQLQTGWRRCPSRHPGQQTQVARPYAIYHQSTREQCSCLAICGEHAHAQMHVSGCKIRSRVRGAAKRELAGARDGQTRLMRLSS